MTGWQAGDRVRAYIPSWRRWITGTIVELEEYTPGAWRAVVMSDGTADGWTSVLVPLRKLHAAREA